SSPPTLIEMQPFACLGRLRSASIASITFDGFPNVFFNSGVLLSLETEPKRAQKHRVLRQFRDSKAGALAASRDDRSRCASACNFNAGARISSSRRLRQVQEQPGRPASNTDLAVSPSG